VAPDPPPHGRHQVDGKISLERLAHWCRTTPAHIVWLTMEMQVGDTPEGTQPGFGDLQRRYINEGDFSKRMPAGMVVCVP
jgi:hypothetical protein